MKRKGFTLIELIISITIIVLIGVISVSIVFSKKSDPEKELMSLVTDSASVNYYKNSENVNKIKDNYGYQVYTVEELINSGLLDEKQINDIKTKMKEENKKCSKPDPSGNDELWCYDKVIIYYNFNSDGEIGFIYPYEELEHLMLLRKDVEDITYIKFNNNTSNFNCTHGIKDNNPQNFSYLTKDYELKTYNASNLSKLKCNISELKDSKEDLDLNPPSLKLEKFQDSSLDDSLEDISNYKSSYNFSNFGYGIINYALEIDGDNYFSINSMQTPRVIYVVDYSGIELKVKNVANGRTSDITDTNKWYRGSLQYSIVDAKGEQLEANDDIDIVWKNYNSNNGKSSLSVTGSGTYNISVTVSDKADSNNKKDLTLSGIKLDNILPKIVVTSNRNNQLKFTVSDEHSGIDFTSIKIKKSGDERKLTCSSTCTLDLSTLTNYQDYSIVVSDRAGNEASLSLSDLISVDVIPIENSIFQFKIDVQGNVDEKKVEFNFSKLDTQLQSLFQIDPVIASEGESFPTFDFYELVETNIINKYRGKTDTIPYFDYDDLDDLVLHAKVTTTKGGKESIFNFEIKLNYRVDFTEEYAFGNYLDQANGCTPYIKGFNSNSEVAFSKYCNPGRDSWKNESLYLAKKTGSIVNLLNLSGIYSSTNYNARSSISVTSFNQSKIEYGFYDSFAGACNNLLRPPKCKACYDTYIYTYDIDNSKYSNESYLSNNTRSKCRTSTGLGGSDYYKPSNYRDFTSVSDVKRYTMIDEYLEFYYDIEKRNYENPSRFYIMGSDSSSGVAYVLIRKNDYNGIVVRQTIKAAHETQYVYGMLVYKDVSVKEL